MKVPEKKIDWALWAIGLCIALSALTKIRLLLGIPDYRHLWEQALVVSLFASAVFGSAGLFYRKTWGFFFVYAYVWVGTFFFSISAIPFPFSLLKMNAKSSTLLLLGINLVFVIFAGCVHAIKSKSDRKTVRQMIFK